MDSCWFDLPGGVALELLDYLEPVEDAYEHGNAHPGNVHVCLHVDDMEAAHAHALAAGAVAVSPAPITIGQGPKAGTKVAYVRDPDGVTIELLQPRQAQ
jgi:catechol 2,3-dioxygenase-like lactoylglutathione lyase family enzyme